ncbi:DUF4367 domain-containing protein [Paenibacillus guangzhouensis]|uniref:DUF4367 domain-containing protein n=1 Tax=Paenibacillus guangzhouensis TaxID=1473112 RepID=UPI001266C7E8|nr:DUF4367 domain-containing protein [Paenibacillus guangzhouensis]
MQIKNNRGDVIGKIQFYSHQNEDKVNQIISELRPGDGKAIYNAGAIDNKFSQQTNYAATNWDQDFGSLKEKLSPWQPLFPTLSKIQSMQVYYGFDNLLSHEIDEMIEESKRTGVNVVVRDLKPNRTIVGVNISYHSDQGTFTFRIFGTTKSRIQVSDSEDSKIDHFDVRGNEAFYILSDGHHQLIWLEEDLNGKVLQYELMGRDISKEVLLNIVASMM